MDCGDSLPSALTRSPGRSDRGFGGFGGSVGPPVADRSLGHVGFGSHGVCYDMQASQVTSDSNGHCKATGLQRVRPILEDLHVKCCFEMPVGLRWSADLFGSDEPLDPGIL